MRHLLLLCILVLATTGCGSNGAHQTVDLDTGERQGHDLDPASSLGPDGGTGVSGPGGGATGDTEVPGPVGNSDGSWVNDDPADGDAGSSASGDSDDSDEVGSGSGSGDGHTPDGPIPDGTEHGDDGGLSLACLTMASDCLPALPPATVCELLAANPECAGHFLEAYEAEGCSSCWLLPVPGLSDACSDPSCAEVLALATAAVGDDLCSACADVCQPDCGGMECGSDTCTGSCGTCGPGEQCDNGTCAKDESEITCQEIIQQCAPGVDGFTAALVCQTVNGHPACLDLLVGAYDASGGQCSSCEALPIPGIDLLCEAPECSSLATYIGLVPGGPEACETCTDGGCPADCDGKECGSDGCGDICGTCGAGQQCEDGTCVETVPPPTCQEILDQCAPSLDPLLGTFACQALNGQPACLGLLVDAYVASGGACSSCDSLPIPGVELFCEAPECAALSQQLAAFPGAPQPCELCASGGCEADCTGKECGFDGCNDSCGVCGGGEICVAGICEATIDEGVCTDLMAQCAPDITGQELVDTCALIEASETCLALLEASPFGSFGAQCSDCDVLPLPGLEAACAVPECVTLLADVQTVIGGADPCGSCEEICEPDCEGKECGPDSCGESCGDCIGADVCSASGICECAGGTVQQCCGSNICNLDECSGTLSVAQLCPNGCAEGACLGDCTPPTKIVGSQCVGGNKHHKHCSGLVSFAEACEFGCANGECVPCLPDCTSNECGNGGCPGSTCGACADDAVCEGGQCVVVSSCGGVTFEGECQDDQLLWCNDTTVVEQDCAADGKVCALNVDAGFFDCVTASEEHLFLPAFDNAMVGSNLDKSLENKTYTQSWLPVGTDSSAGVLGDGSTSGFTSHSTALFFDLAAISGKKVETAVLHLSPAELAATTDTNYWIAGFSAGWSPSTLTYLNAPAPHGGPAVWFEPPTAGVTLAIEVTVIVEKWASGEWANNGFFIFVPLTGPPVDTAVRTTWFHASDVYGDPAWRPTLYVQTGD